jgi:hypothetical protein
MVGRASAFIEMIQHASPNFYSAFEPILSLTAPEMEDDLMRRVYDQLPIGDFSKLVLSATTEKLAVTSLGISAGAIWAILVGWSSHCLRRASRTRGSPRGPAIIAASR